MKLSPCPTSHMLEDVFYSDMSDIVMAINKMYDFSGKVPTKEYAKKFKEKN